MRTRTLANLRSDVLVRADMPNTTFISTANLNEMINQSVARLFGRLVSVRGQDYFMKSATFTTSAGTGTYAFSSMTPAVADFFQLIQLEIADGTLQRVVQPVMQKELPRWREYGVPAGYTFTVRYVPAPTRMTNDADLFDGIAGWEEWVVLDCAIKLLNAEESDVSILMAMKQEMEQSIDQLASDRDAGWPERVVDVSRKRLNHLFNGGVPRYRLVAATGIDGAGQGIEVAWGPVNGAFAW